MREEELIIYKEFADGDILRDVVWLMEHYRLGGRQGETALLQVYAQALRIGGGSRVLRGTSGTVTRQTFW